MLARVAPPPSPAARGLARAAIARGARVALSVDDPLEADAGVLRRDRRLALGVRRGLRPGERRAVGAPRWAAWTSRPAGGRGRRRFHRVLRAAVLAHREDLARDVPAIAVRELRPPRRALRLAVSHRGHDALPVVPAHRREGGVRRGPDGGGRDRGDPLPASAVGLPARRDPDRARADEQRLSEGSAGAQMAALPEHGVRRPADRVRDRSRARPHENRRGPARDGDGGRPHTWPS